MDEVFKALADPNRRWLLDRLEARNGQSLRELCHGAGMTRQSVSKHLDVLVAAGVVTTVRRGREKLHHLDAAPLNAIADRWLSRYDRHRAQALADLTAALAADGPAAGEPGVGESRAGEGTAVRGSAFVYTTYVAASPERVWRALTEPAWTRRYWGAELHSDWRVGSRVLWREGGGEPADLGQVVLEADPHRRLAYGWHAFQPYHAACFGWSDDELAAAQAEPRSQVAFDLEPAGGSPGWAGTATRLTVRHDGFVPDSRMLAAISGRLPGSGGWPELFAGLKTLLETGRTLAEAAAEPTIEPRTDRRAGDRG